MLDQYKIHTNPVGHSVALSAIFAALPLLTLFVLLGIVRMKAWLAALISLAVALVVAVAIYAMPVGQALLANTAPVAFGALATPIVTLASVAHGANPDPRLTVDTLGSMVGRQTPFLALIVPLMLVALVDGRRGLRQTWPAALTAGVTFAVAQYAASNFVSVPLTDIIASLLAALSLVLLVRVWQPVESPDLRTEPAELATVG